MPPLDHNSPANLVVALILFGPPAFILAAGLESVRRHLRARIYKENKA